MSEIKFDDPTIEAIAFPVLTDAQIAALRPLGKELKLKAGTMVWEPGQENLCVFIVVSGEMEIIEPRTKKEIAVHMAGHFSGDIDVISGRRSLFAAQAKTDLDLIEVSGDEVKSLVGKDPELGEIFLRAFLLRRRILQASSELGLLVVGSRFDRETMRIREFLARCRFPVIWQDIESDIDAAQILKDFHVKPHETPIVVLSTGKVLRRPSNADLGCALGILKPIDNEVIYDVVIVGAGPAGLAAGVYGASEGLRTLVVDSEAPGGQAGSSSRIENYFGFPEGISGQTLTDHGVVQAERFGAQFLNPVNVISLTCADAGLHELEIERMGKIATKCVILATGAQYQALDVENFEDYEGRGIYYAATNIEREVCATQNVAVVGAGNSAGQAAVFMAETSPRVLLIVRGDNLRKSMSSYLADRIDELEAAGRVIVMLNSAVCQLSGENTLEKVSVRNKATGEACEEQIGGMFVMIGALPRTEWLRGNSKVKLDSKGFVLTGIEAAEGKCWKQSRAPFFLESTCPGVFAVGDARRGSIKRVASAVGEGSMAIALVHQYLAL